MKNPFGSSPLVPNIELKIPVRWMIIDNAFQAVALIKGYHIYKRI